MKMPRSRKFQGFPLQLVLIAPFVLQIFAAVGLVGYLSLRNGQKAVNDLANQLMERTSSSVNQHLDAYLSIPHQLGQINADAVRLGLLDVSDREAIGQYFWQQMQAYDVSYIGIGLTTGEGVGAARYDGKTVTIDDWSAKPPDNWYSYATDHQGNRTTVLNVLDWNNFNEPWYTEPVKAGKPIWSPIYTIYYPKYPYVAASAGRPIYNAQNQLLGMVSIDVSLLKLGEFLQDLEVSHSGKVFILERDGTLIANSGTEQPYTSIDGKVQRLQAIDSPNPIVQSIASQLQQRFNGFSEITTAEELQLHIQDEPYYVHITPWRDDYGLDWLMVVGVPEQTFMGQINVNTRTTILLCCIALGLSSIVGVFSSRWITRPILRLSQASTAVSTGNLEQVVVNSGIQELNTLANSFNQMTDQLHESFTSLEKSNAELETRVESRTAELETALSELQRTQTQMIQSEKMSSLGQLVAGVAHEINNPVNFIHGNLTHTQQYAQDLLEFVQLYQQHYPEPNPEIQAAAEDIDLEFLQDDLPKVLASMHLGTDRIRQIVLSLRNFSRMDEAEVKAVDIHEGIDSTLMILQHRLKPRSDRTEIEIIKHYSSLPLVECYAGQLNQVFMNILVNAIDALEERETERRKAKGGNPKADSTHSILQEGQSPLPFISHPTISVRTSVIDDQWVQIEIADNGAGMPKEVQHRIFNPFFTTKPSGKGTGMGMSISYQIVTEKHRGKLECLSVLGEGTQFLIQIPLRQSVYQPTQTVS